MSNILKICNILVIDFKMLCYILLISDLLLSMAGLGTPIRRGLGGISLLKWSPSGDYFFSAKLYTKLPFDSLKSYLLFEDTHYVINKDESGNF